jgi:hypothetical protein
LLFVSTQVPLQRVVPDPHAQVPLWQVAPAPHECPQLLQLAASVWRFTQPPLHTVSPLGHCEAHWPDEQTSPAGQGLPQVPQFWPSLIRFTH